MRRDLYAVLGVERDADSDTIKQAYRALARQLHPDVSGREDADEQFREVTEAYVVLSDPGSRRVYDRLGWHGPGSGFAPRKGIGRVYASNPRAFLDDLESILASALGGRPAQEPARVVGEVELDAYEAHVGATRSVEVAGTQTCLACTGTGRRKVVADAASARYVSLERCVACAGSGEIEEERAVEITVPPRSRELDSVRLNPDEVTIVRIVPPRERVAVRLAASAALLAAVAFLLFLLSV